MRDPRCNPMGYGVNPGPCGPMPCTGECAGSGDQDSEGLCELCPPGRASWALYVTEDLEHLCERCCREIGAEVRYVLWPPDEICKTTRRAFNALGS
jgi:hypothetical protein